MRKAIMSTQKSERSERIFLRVDKERKSRFKEAARKNKQSLTNWMINLGDREIAKEDKDEQEKRRRS